VSGAVCVLVLASGAAASGATTYTLTVTLAGSGSGAVTSSPAGIDCGSTCSHEFAVGTRVTLTATAGAGSFFTGWSEGGCSGIGTCEVTLSTAESVTATFGIVPSDDNPLSVTKAGSGSGTVTSSPAGIDCGSTCSDVFPSRTVVALTATAASGSTFTGWSGAGCSGTGSCQVTMSAAAWVTATFDEECVVPKLIGTALKAAEHALGAGNCRVGRITRVFSETVQRGHVISQKPKPHKRLRGGAEVALTVSDGARKVLLGRSVDGRPIVVHEVGNPVSPRRELVVGCIHGNEPAGIAVARRVERTSPTDVDLWIVPVLNPDGLAAGTRGNADGVDLNRNFPYRWQMVTGVYDSGPRPLSEPESRIAYRLIRRLRPQVSIWFHQHLDVVDESGGQIAVERRFAELVGLPLRRLAREPGSVVGWTNHVLPGSTSFVVELPAGSLSGPAVARFARATVRSARG
jgi:murein peptide amidase A